MARIYGVGPHLGPRQCTILRALADRLDAGLTPTDLGQVLAGDAALYEADPDRWRNMARDSLRSLMLRRYVTPIDAEAHTGSWHLTYGRWTITPAGTARLAHRS